MTGPVSKLMETYQYNPDLAYEELKEVPHHAIINMPYLKEALQEITKNLENPFVQRSVIEILENIENGDGKHGLGYLGKSNEE